MEDPAYLDGIAEQALRAVDADMQSAIGMGVIASSMGLQVVRVPYNELPSGVLGLLDGRLILVRTGLSPVCERFVVGHEIGHYLCAHTEHSNVEEEEANYVGASLIVPRKALRCAMRFLGEDIDALACAFRASQTSVALRLAECGVVSAVAVVEPTIVRARSRAPFVFPNEPIIRKLASKPVGGMRRVRLTDDSRRIALFIDELEECA